MMMMKNSSTKINYPINDIEEAQNKKENVEFEKQTRKLGLKVKTRTQDNASTSQERLRKRLIPR